MKLLKLNCKTLDELLGGGVYSGSITEIYGEAGSGKTNICLQASIQCALKGKKVAYIASRNISLERVNQLCKDEKSKDFLSNILFFYPSSYQEQEKMIKNALEINDIELIILDSFNTFYSLLLEKDKKLAIRILNRQITELQLSAMEKDLLIIIVGQVFSIENDDVRPFGGKVIQRMVKTILKLEKLNDGRRMATIIKHPIKENGLNAVFKITEKGLE